MHMLAQRKTDSSKTRTHDITTVSTPVNLSLPSELIPANSASPNVGLKANYQIEDDLASLLVERAQDSREFSEVTQLTRRTQATSTRLRRPTRQLQGSSSSLSTEAVATSCTLTTPVIEVAEPSSDDNSSSSDPSEKNYRFSAEQLVKEQQTLDTQPSRLTVTHGENQFEDKVVFDLDTENEFQARLTELARELATLIQWRHTRRYTVTDSEDQRESFWYGLGNQVVMRGVICGYTLAESGCMLLVLILFWLLLVGTPGVFQ